MSDKPLSDDEIAGLRAYFDFSVGLTPGAHALVMSEFDRLVAELRRAREEVSDSEDEWGVLQGFLLDVQTALDMRCTDDPNRVTCVDKIGTEAAEVSKIVAENASLRAQLEEAKREKELLFRFYDKAVSFVRLSTQFGGFSEPTYSPIPTFRVKALDVLYREIDAARASQANGPCQYCGDVGWTVVTDHHSACDGSCKLCPVERQVQCPCPARTSQAEGAAGEEGE